MNNLILTCLSLFLLNFQIFSMDMVISEITEKEKLMLEIYKELKKSEEPKILLDKYPYEFLVELLEFLQKGVISITDHVLEPTKCIYPAEIATPNGIIGYSMLLSNLNFEFTVLQNQNTLIKNKTTNEAVEIESNESAPYRWHYFKNGLFVIDYISKKFEIFNLSNPTNILATGISRQGIDTDFENQFDRVYLDNTQRFLIRDVCIESSSIKKIYSPENESLFYSNYVKLLKYERYEIDLNSIKSIHEIMNRS